MTQSELTDTNDYNVNDTFYKMHTREFPSSVHGEVSESPEDVTEPRIEERTDDRKKIAEERNCTDSKTTSQSVYRRPGAWAVKLTSFSNDECDDPNDRNNTDPNTPTLGGMLSPVDTLLVKDLEEDRTGSDQGVQNSDDNLYERRRLSAESQWSLLWTYDGGQDQSSGSSQHLSGKGSITGSYSKLGTYFRKEKSSGYIPRHDAMEWRD
jgi:hypothetical protein